MGESAIAIIMSLGITILGLSCLYVSKDKRTFVRQQRLIPKWGRLTYTSSGLEQLRALYKVGGLLFAALGVLFFITAIVGVVMETVISRH